MNQSTAKPSAPEGDNKPLALYNLRVLLVEDDRLLNEMLTDFFTSFCGAKVSSVPLAAEALEAIRSQKPDILISNIGLPDEDGYSLMQKVRRLASEQGRMIPAIALTAAPSATNPKRILEAGFQGYFSKPFSLEEFVKEITILTSPDSRQNHEGSIPKEPIIFSQAN